MEEKKMPYGDGTGPVWSKGFGRATGFGRGQGNRFGCKFENFSFRRRLNGEFSVNDEKHAVEDELRILEYDEKEIQARKEYLKQRLDELNQHNSSNQNPDN